MTNLRFQRLEAAAPIQPPALHLYSGLVPHLHATADYWREQCLKLTAGKVPLTVKQEVAFNALKRYDKANGRSPTLREFADGLGTTVSNAHRYLIALEERGWISRLPGRERAITILETGK